MSTQSELLAERAELIAKNEAATGWGAAVGARSERIKAIDSEIRRLESAVPEPVRDAQQTPEPSLREQFESVITALNYDGNDTDSLTVGEIRRALP